MWNWTKSENWDSAVRTHLAGLEHGMCRLNWHWQWDLEQAELGQKDTVLFSVICCVCVFEIMFLFIL